MNIKYNKSILTNKIIDIHVHSGMSFNGFIDNLFPCSFSILELESILKMNNIDFACVFPFPSYLCGNAWRDKPFDIGYLRMQFEKIPYYFSNLRLLNEIERFCIKDMLPCFMFSINYAINDQIAFLKETSSYIYGLKYYADADTRKITDLLSIGKPFINFLLEYDLPLFVHVSEDACLYGHGYSNVIDAIKIAQLFPELRINVAHLGHFCKEAITLANAMKLPNLYFDTSPLLHLCFIRNIKHSSNALQLDYQSPQKVLESLYNLLPDNLLWGSDIPFNFACDLSNNNHTFLYEEFSVKKNYDIINSMNQCTKMKICSNNPINFLLG